MKQKLLLLFKTYILIIMVFVVQKPLFMIFYHNLYQPYTLLDYINVLYHGLLLDTSMAGYMTVLPGFIIIASLWVKPTWIKQISVSYFGFISILISVIFVADLNLYGYWGFRLDSTPLFYLRSFNNAIASVNWIVIVIGILSMIIIALLLFYLFYRLLINHRELKSISVRKLPVALVLLLVTALLFIPIRGGFTVSTMNVGKVYFSDQLELNHAAINPCFSFFESLTLQHNFAKQYRFMSDAEAKTEFKMLVDKPETDSIPQLFTVQHPNVVIIVLESFMSKVISPLGGIPNVAVRINGFCKEGILFTNFYASSFRTDRGLVSIFSGYPAQPSTSIMKYPQKTQSLPSIPKSLKKAGYNLQYYYGGDADFTNMRSYLTAMGIKNIITDQNFPLKERMTKWGAPDQYVFNRLSTDLNGNQQEPFFKALQTLSSHEPFEVPYHKFDDLYLNSVAYTDSCLGGFIDQFKQTKWWKNSIVILVPDHAMHYPANIDNRSVDRYKIPLLILGGAIKSPCFINTYASQIDIAATVLEQLHLDHKDFTFSKNILNPASAHFGYFTFQNGFGMVTPENQFVFDYESKSVFLDSGSKGQNEKKAKALLQILYNDLESR